MFLLMPTIAIYSSIIGIFNIVTVKNTTKQTLFLLVYKKILTDTCEYIRKIFYFWDKVSLI